MDGRVGEEVRWEGESEQTFSDGGVVMCEFAELCVQLLHQLRRRATTRTLLQILRRHMNGCSGKGEDDTSE